LVFRPGSQLMRKKKGRGGRGEYVVSHFMTRFARGRGGDKRGNMIIKKEEPGA